MRKVDAENPSKIIVELIDGRVQEIDIQGFYGIEKKTVVSIVERKGKREIRSESTNTLYN